MAEFNVPPCPTHGALPKPLHTENFRGAVDAIIQIIDTVSGVGTVSYSKCAYGYDANFNGLVRALEDLNTTISGIAGGADIQAGSGIYFTASGDVTVINASVTSASGIVYTAGSGIYLTGSQFNVNFNQVFQGSVSGHILGAGDNVVYYSGNTVTVSGSGESNNPPSDLAVTVSGAPSEPYYNGSLWFDTNQGRLFVYASGEGIASPAWYQTNSEAIVLKGDTPPSGTGVEAPPRDGSVWFNTLVGNLFIYDAVTSGWYETGPSRSVAYGAVPPPPSDAGAGWYSSTESALKIWNGSAWVNAN